MVELLMQWVAAGAPQPGRGLPTGAVVSPLLAKLFLEQFDRQVQEDGGLLVRYADDFVLLFRDPGKGRQVLARAAEVAEQLKLRLNDDKTKLLELENTPFDFLSFRFFSEKAGSTRPTDWCRSRIWAGAKCPARASRRPVRPCLANKTSNPAARVSGSSGRTSIGSGSKAKTWSAAAARPAPKTGSSGGACPN